MKFVTLILFLEKLLLVPPKPKHITKTLNYVLVSDKLDFLRGNFDGFESFMDSRRQLSLQNKAVHYQHHNHSALIKALARDSQYDFLLQQLSGRYENYISEGSLKRKELLELLEMEFKSFQSKKNNVANESTIPSFSQHAFVIYYHYLNVYEPKQYPRLNVTTIKKVVKSRVYKQYIGSVRYEGVKKHMEAPFPLDRKNIMYTLKALNEAIAIAHCERNERIADTLIRKLSKIHTTYMDVRGINPDDIAS